MCGVFWFFFFKQKTAYEMRISDWSSDVCSSDLDDLPAVPGSVDEIPAQLDLGGPVRNTQKSNAMHASGKLFSPKNDRLMGWESHLEKRAMVLLECDPAVTRYCAQPMTLRYELDGPLGHYPPDTFVCRYYRLQIVEVKPSPHVHQDVIRLHFPFFPHFFRP